ncbi:hypothetical protein BLS_002006 [Venturia inaequalis]|uniref:CUE domain-containing protein n=1 Tax=Venturia inaequalis TaxID=5025 RepID=A0A8H3U1H0_VENIN|nr:hypothetical protein BLS_002006 [Venturia inaequalis]KAE9971847.1 hypothetical protein EG328_005328 [Venturia inaequalis]KAE9986066.1 hypothetical protein EG327_004477 [Venturia inaequalis]RDI87318.1 putative efflux pump [Venturia inaequalis]
MAEAQTISLPQILVFLVVGLLIIRWFFASGTPTSSGAQNGATAHGSRVNPAHVEQLLAMFPQLDRRTVIWELQKNGGNVNRIAETVLGGGRLSIPPPTFQPPMPQPSTNARAATRPGPTHPDLITKYNLASKLAEGSTTTSSEPVPSTSTPNQRRSPAWSTDKTQRQASLLKKKQEMILKARRAMEERDKAANA